MHARVELGGSVSQQDLEHSLGLGCRPVQRRAPVVVLGLCVSLGSHQVLYHLVKGNGNSNEQA